MSIWSGKSLNNVVIGDLIARGGMAEVYYGKHANLNRNVAVKIMRDHVEEDPDSRARFDREARVVAGLSHPNIIQIFDYDLVDGRPCIIMELVTGAPLSSYMKALQKRGEKLPPETIAQLLKPIASAMDYAHERNIVHRDIKPANILLRSKSGQVNVDEPLPEDVEPVLTDFGLVRLLDSTTQTSTGTVSGTPSYMSPEQARGDRVDRRTDIYSLGVVLYEMVAGVVPFDAESSFGVLMKHLNEPPPPIPGISTGMQAVINRALAKDPAHRFESAGDLVEEFTAILKGKPLSEKTEQVNGILKQATVAQQPVAAPSRLPLIVGGIITLALIAVFGVWLLRPPLSAQQPQQPQQVPGQSVGRVTYIDFSDVMDKAIINVNGLPLPQLGTHYEVWFLGQGGESRRNAGIVSFDGESGQLSFLNPGGINLLAEFDQLEVTVEPNNDPQPDQPSPEVIASSVFPPLALIHVRHVLVAIGSTPDGIALIQGLWYATDTIDTSVQELDTAFDEGDEETLRLMNEEIINQLVGSANLDLYKDWNEDGEIDDPGDGYGLLLNGEEHGYLPETAHHAQLAADASDATKNIIETSAELKICIENMEDWGGRLLELALQLQDMPFGPEMESTIAEMQILSSHLLYGEDANGNGRIEATPGEGGADTAYEFAYFMSEMPLLHGPNKIPLPGK